MAGLNIEAATTKRFTVASHDGILMKAQRFHAMGKSWSVRLFKDAEMGGDKVKLNCEMNSAAVLALPKSLATIQLVDEAGAPAGGRKYVIVTSDGERSGVLNDKGEAELELDADANLLPGRGQGGERADSVKPYVIRQGDYVTKIAHLHGFDAATSLEQHQEPEDPREAARLEHHPPRRRPVNPDRTDRRPLLVKNGTTNRYVANIPKMPVELRIQVGGEALPNEPYLLLGLGPDPNRGRDGQRRVARTTGCRCTSASSRSCSPSGIARCACGSATWTRSTP